MSSLTQTRRRDKREQSQREALERARRPSPNGNDMPVTLQFVSRGIPANDIETFGPGQNVYTYKAWRALGRQVRRGEKSVRCCVWRTIEVKPDPETGKEQPDRRIPVTACVFHISQTDPVNGKDGA